MLLLPTATYRASDFLDAARALDIEVLVGSEEPQTLAPSLVVPFDDPAAAADVIVEAAASSPVDAIVAVDEPGVVPAALAAARLGLPHNPADAVAATRDKARLRTRLAAASVSQPAFAVVHADGDVDGNMEAAVATVGLPCVVKPVSLSGSKGVIRADSTSDAIAASARIRAMADDPTAPILVEAFAPGKEVAVEGIVEAGRFTVLAIFDKPDQVDGPYFPETLLVSPSRLDAEAQARVRDEMAAAVSALGLVEGPVHGEARVELTAGGAVVRILEIAARSIGGLCARALRFGTGMSLEEVILRHAVGLPIASLDRERTAVGVAMLYAPSAGVLREVTGRDAAASVPGVEEIEITAPPGTIVAPLPEDARYLGFVFARGEEPAQVEQALRAAVAHIGMVVVDP